MAIEQRIYEVIRRIPRGRVATYGEVAELAGLPAGHRVVARALRNCPRGVAVPWQRVVGKLGRAHARISIQSPDGQDLQRAMLEAEGVSFDARGRIALRQHGLLWEPQEVPPPRRADAGGGRRDGHR